MAYRKTEKVLSKIAATRSLLIACAIDIIAAEGLEGLNTRALAAKAEVAHGSVYMHFADTKELIVVVASELRARDIDAMWQATEGAQSPRAILIAGISMLSHIVASQYRLRSAFGLMPAYRDPVQRELAQIIKAASPKERPAILAAMAIRETVAGSVDEYVALAARLAREPERRAALAATIRDAKHRLFRDRETIAALEDFLERAVRQS